MFQCRKRESISFLSGQWISKSIQYEISMNRYDWHILAGNKGRIVVHCWFVKDAKHTYVAAGNIRFIFHPKKPESSLTRKRMHEDPRVERTSSWLNSVRSLSTGNEPGCSPAQWEDQSGVTCREVGNHGDSHESSEFIQCRVEQDVWCLQPGWVQFSTLKSHTRTHCLTCLIFPLDRKTDSYYQSQTKFEAR